MLFADRYAACEWLFAIGKKKLHENWGCLEPIHAAYFNCILFLFAFPLLIWKSLCLHQAPSMPRPALEQILSLLFLHTALLTVTAGSILAPFDVQICKEMEQIILAKGQQRFPCTHAEAQQNCSASIHSSAAWRVGSCCSFGNLSAGAGRAVPSQVTSLVLAYCPLHSQCTADHQTALTGARR